MHACNKIMFVHVKIVSCLHRNWIAIGFFYSLAVLAAGHGCFPCNRFFSWGSIYCRMQWKYLYWEICNSIERKKLRSHSKTCIIYYISGEWVRVVVWVWFECYVFGFFLCGRYFHTVANRINGLHFVITQSGSLNKNRFEYFVSSIFFQANQSSIARKYGGTNLKGYTLQIHAVLLSRMLTDLRVVIYAQLKEKSCA